jgi:excisionase family DNA binding protein
MKQLHDVKSAARLLSISPWTVRSYIHDGKLKAVRIGRRVLLCEEELERLIAGNQVEEVNPQPPEHQEVGQCKDGGSHE